jgi:hypothetical protein
VGLPGCVSAPEQALARPGRSLTGFLEYDVLANDRIILFEFEPLGRVLLVLLDAVNVRAFGAFELDGHAMSFACHKSSTDSGWGMILTARYCVKGTNVETFER